MPTRLRKLLGSLAILAFLFFYVGVATKLADLVPDLWWAKLLFFLLAGTLWGAPLIPLISWMNRGP